MSLAQLKFLLDANLSPKIARFLARKHRLDVKALLSIGLAQIPDNQVLTVAARENRVIITLDQDFEDFFFHSARAHQPGIVFLDLRAGLTNNQIIKEVLDTFFVNEAPSIDFEHTLIVLTHHTATVHRAPQIN